MKQYKTASAVAEDKKSPTRLGVWGELRFWNSAVHFSAMFDVEAPALPAEHL